MTSTHSRVDVRPRGCALRSEEGSILMLTALSMVVLLGMLALAVDGSYMYTERNRMAAAADAAARAGAQEYRRDPASNLQAFANREVVRHGFNPAVDTTVTVNRPPSSGSFTANPNYVEVIVSRPTASFFARILSNVWATMTPGARAVAGTSSGPNCIVILGTESDALELANNVVVNMPGCGIADAGGVDVGGSANTRVITSGVSLAVGSCPDATIMPNCVPNSPPPTDPLATLPPLSDPGGTCSGPMTISGTVAITPGKYCGFTFQSGSWLQMAAGNYYITGPITANNPGTVLKWTGTGVMVFLASANGQVNLDSNKVNMELSAPVGGTYNGILFYQQRGNVRDAVLSKNNTNDMRLSGAMYFPDAELSVKNNNGVVLNDCTLIVAKELEFNNNSTLTNGCAAYGGSPIRTVTLAE